MSYYQEYVDYKNKYHRLLDIANSGPKIKLGSNLNSGTNPKPFPLADEIHFWAKQTMEHQLMLFLGLEDVSDFQLKQKAFELHAKWKDFLNKNFYDKGIKVGNLTVELTSDDLAKVSNIDLRNLNDLINQTIDFTNKIIKALMDGNWIGWVYPSLANHMLEETEYFARKINGPDFSIDEEITYANHHHSGELAVTAQLIDPEPSQQKIIDLVRSYSMKKMSAYNAEKSLAGKDFNLDLPTNWSQQDELILQGMHPEEQASLLFISIRYGREVCKLAEDTGNKIRSKQLKSIIAPFIADHVLREFIRFTKTLENIQSGQSQIV